MLYQFKNWFGLSVASSRVSAATNAILIAAPIATQRIRVLGLLLHTLPAGNIKLTDSTGTVQLGHEYDFTTNSGLVLGTGELYDEWPLGEPLKWITDIGGRHMVRIYYAVV